MQKPPTVKDGGFWLYAVQRHRALGGFVVFIESPCYMLKAVLLCYRLQSRRHVCCFGIASPHSQQRLLTSHCISQGRVCLELIPKVIVRIRSCTKTWKPFQRSLFKSAEVKRSDWLTCCKRKKRTDLPQTAFRSRLQTTLCCINRKLFLWWTIRKKRELDSCRCVLQSWINWISYEAPLGNQQCQKQAVTFVLVKSVKETWLLFTWHSG